MAAVTKTGTPVEAKVAAGSATAVLTGVVTWVLVTYVHTFAHGLPPTLATFLPWAVSAVTSSYAAWRAPHTPRSLIQVQPPAEVSVPEPQPAPDPAAEHGVE